MPLGGGLSMRSAKTVDPQEIISRLESDEPLPDDDPRTRRGGLNPQRQQDLPQIQFYAQARQSGAMSDKAWARLIQRNPNAATLFSAVGLNPEIGRQKRQQQILGQYFSPEQPGMTPATPRDDEGNINTVIPPQAGREDYANAIRSALQSGDTKLASDLRQQLTAQSQGQGRGNYFTYFDSPEGIVAADARSPRLINPITQQPITSRPIKSQNSPVLQAKLAFGKTAGKEVAEVDVKQNEAAIAAAENVTKTNNLLKQLRESDAITGMGADVFKNIERAKVLFSDSRKAGKKVSDTEYLDALMGSEVFPMISALGIGARGLDTPAEREFLRQVMTGTIPMNKQTLIRLTETRKQVAERAIERWNKRVDSGQMDNYFQLTGRPKQRIELDKEKAEGGKFSDAEYEAARKRILGR